MSKWSSYHVAFGQTRIADARDKKASTVVTYYAIYAVILHSFLKLNLIFSPPCVVCKTAPTLGGLILTSILSALLPFGSFVLTLT